MKILILISIISVAFGCRSKQKIISDYKEKTREAENIKVDSLSQKSSKFIQNETADVIFLEKKNEISSDVSIKGKSDLSNPFLFHNVVGIDTIQSISIMGNAEYIINNRFTKTDNNKTEIRKEDFTHIIQDLSQNNVSKENIREVNSVISAETKEIKAKGLQAGTWIVVTIIVIFLLFIFFVYKYFKK